MYADSNVESYEKVLNQVLIGKLLEEMMDKDVKKLYWSNPINLWLYVKPYR